MMDGITVLSQEPILMGNFALAVVVGVIALSIMMFVGLWVNLNENLVGLLCGMVFLLSAFVVLRATAEPTGR